MTELADVDFVAISAPLLVATAAIVILLGDAFAAQRSWLLHTLSSSLVLAVAVGIGWALSDEPRATMCTGPVPDRGRETVAACSFVVDQFTVAVWTVVGIGALLVVLMAVTLGPDRDLPPGEFHFLLLCSVSGALTVAAARDLVTMVIALELVSLPSIAMVALRHGDLRAARSGWTFYLTSVVSTAVTLMGISLLYGAIGTVHYSRFGAEVGIGLTDDEHRVAVAGALLTALGLFFKLGAVPFHMWVPDTYRGAAVPVAAYLSVVSKAAGLAAIAVFVTVLLDLTGEPLALLVAVVAAVTMTVGNIAALRQDDTVGLLAWSSVAHAGFVLAPLATVSSIRGLGRFDDGVAAAVAYLAIYALANLAAFSVVAYVRQARGSTSFEAMRGLARRDRLSGLAMAFALLTLAGFPPAVVGLVAKYVSMRPVLAGEHQWLAVVMAVNIAIGLAYYLRLMVLLFVRTTPEPSERASVVTRFGVLVGALAMVATSVWPQAVLALVTG